jgi:hypothetical protein
MVGIMATKWTKSRLIPPLAGVVGAVALLALGWVGNDWLLELKNSGVIADYDSMPQEVEDQHFPLQLAVFFSLICGLAGLVFSVLLLWGKGPRWMNASLILVAGAVPLVMWSFLCLQVSGLVLLPPILLVTGGLMNLAVEYG